MKEIWKPIKNYEGLYEVSNLGRVRSLDRITKYTNRHGNESSQFRQGEIKNQCDNGNGYKIVNLYKNNKGKTFYVHRLVVEAFRGEIPEKMAVNHIDFNTENNNLDNLEVVTYAENNWHSSRSGRYEDKRGSKVRVFFKDGTTKEYPSMTKASKQLNIHRDTLIKAIHKGGNHGKLKFSQLGIAKVEQFE